jgi:two-component SAPR family response regulator
LYLDVERFEDLIALGDELFDTMVEVALPYYQEALALYQGDFLQESPYDEWCVEERERLQTQYLRVADRVAVTLAAQRAWEETIDVCQAILSYDDCWEGAYRLMMTAYNYLGNRTQAMRTYQRCVERLQIELGVEPAPATVELYKSIQ